MMAILLFQFLWEEKFFPNYIISLQDDLNFHRKRISRLPRIECEIALKKDLKHMDLFFFVD